MLRHKRQRSFLVVAGLVLGFVLPGSAQRGRLASYHERVRFESETIVVASVEIALRDVPAAPNLRVVRYPDQDIRDVSVQDSHAKPMPCDVVVGEGSVEIHFEAPSSPGSFIVHYRVVSSQPIGRVPLMTLGIPPQPGDPAVKVDVVIPDGTRAVGTTFPVMTWNDATHGSADLTTVPTLLLINWKSAADVTFADRWITTESISNVAMFGIILIASLVWYSRSR